MYITKTFAEAFIKAQDSIEGAKKGKVNTFFKDGKGNGSKYADLSACWDACRDALHDNGFAVLQFPCRSKKEGCIGMRTILLHSSGGSIEDVFYVPMKDPTSAQQMGSAITYARRYALCSVVGICPEDDDGNAASKGTAVRKAMPTPESPKEFDLASFTQKVANAKTREDTSGLKALYTELRGSSCPEPAKTANLASLAQTIKELSSGH